MSAKERKNRGRTRKMKLYMEVQGDTKLQIIKTLVEKAEETLNYEAGDMIYYSEGVSIDYRWTDETPNH